MLINISSGNWCIFLVEGRTSVAESGFVVVVTNSRVLDDGCGVFSLVFSFFSFAKMQQSDQKSASLFSVPSDVIQHHLMRYLSRADLVVLSMTCETLRKIFAKWLICNKEISQAPFQSQVLDDIFLEGNFSQLVWFQKTLKYSSLNNMNLRQQMLIAAKGN